MATCSSCGNPNAVHARFCQTCGAALPPEGVETTPDTGEARPESHIDSGIYGGFWVRVVASVIDWIVVGVATGVIAAAAMGMLGVGITLYMITAWLYEALLLASAKQATLGKMAMGLLVTDYDGRRLTFGRATGRHFAKYLSSATFGIGYILVAFTDRKQGLHDLVASTLVRQNSR